MLSCLVYQRPKERIVPAKLHPCTLPILEQPASLSAVQVDPTMQHPFHPFSERKARMRSIADWDQVPPLVYLSLEASLQGKHAVAVLVQS